MIILTYNIPLLMDETNATHWHKLLVSAKDAYNYCTNLLKTNNISLTLKAVHSSCYDKIRANFPLLTSQMAIKCEQAAASALKSVRSNKHKNANIPERTALVMTLDKRLYGSLTISGITLTGAKAHHRDLIPLDLFPKAEEMLTTYKACDPTIFYRDGRFFLSVPFEIPEKPLQSETAVGVDLGMRQLFVTSEGKSFRDTEYLATRREVRYLKKSLQKKGTKSAKKHLKKVRKKEMNQSTDMCYRASKALIESTDASILVLEDLTKIKQSTSKTKEGHNKKKHNNAMAQVPFYKFRTIVAYKAPLSGKRVETVSPAYTSQTDSRTQKRDGERRGRRYICSDGVVLDADYNAAINIAIRSKHPVSSELPFDGTLTPLTGRLLSISQSSQFR